ncbi:hypothetical protein GCM10020366_10170 [Saccharopolyspora gregorii]|uniref:Lipoyl-binding domain-containing protein n=1 Tax=Saccharopolyspora gregorii TaxID=33914 RepID=A0ABP6RL33_9PSEU
MVFVQLPEVGETVEAGGGIGEVESTKSVSDIYAPLAGEIVARNDKLDQEPELVNSDPFGDGWMIEIKLSDPPRSTDCSARATTKASSTRDDR